MEGISFNYASITSLANCSLLQVITNMVEKQAEVVLRKQGTKSKGGVCSLQKV